MATRPYAVFDEKVITHAAEVAHWDRVWAGRDHEQVTWYQATPQRSIDLIVSVAGPGDPIVDIGGGASRLVDHLLDRGYGDLTVVDIAAAALSAAGDRLADRADEVRWVVADVTTVDLGRPVAVWHDRAVFHFLIDEVDRAAYVDRLRAHVPVGGHVVLATFGPNGPEQCSGLPTRRYRAEELAAVLDRDFELRRDDIEIHVSPTGVEQEFVYVLLERVR